MTGVLRKRDKRKEKCHVEMEAEAGVMQLTAKECWQHHKLQQTRKEPPLQVSKGMQLYQHLYFGLLASRTPREEIAV